MLPLSLAERARPVPGSLLVERCATPTKGRFGLILPGHYVGATMVHEAEVVGSGVSGFVLGQHVLLSGMAGDPIFFGTTDERTLWRVWPQQVIALVSPGERPIESEQDPARGAERVPEVLESRFEEGDSRGAR